MFDVAVIMHAWVIYYLNIPSAKLKTTVKQNWRYQDCNWEKTPSSDFCLQTKISTYIARHEDTANEWTRNQWGELSATGMLSPLPGTMIAKLHYFSQYIWHFSNLLTSARKDIVKQSEFKLHIKLAFWNCLCVFGLLKFSQLKHLDCPFIS